MKNFKILLLPVALLFVASCAPQADIDALLGNAQTKDQIFTKIVEDHELMAAFMDKMMANNHAKMMMQGNEDMMGMMLKDDNMMQMMKDNPEMMGSMMGSMMKSEKVMGDMVQMMNQEGMMSDDCLKTCMQNMGDQGMMKDGGSEKKEGEAHEH